MIEDAIEVVQDADIFVIIGTSLVVYPAASLLHFSKYEAMKWLIDPDDLQLPSVPNLKFINEKATTGVDYLVKTLLSSAKLKHS
jgi:NAD-dependent deacetylase